MLFGFSTIAVSCQYVPIHLYNIGELISPVVTIKLLPSLLMLTELPNKVTSFDVKNVDPHVGPLRSYKYTVLVLSSLTTNRSPLPEHPILQPKYPFVTVPVKVCTFCHVPELPPVFCFIYTEPILLLSAYALTNKNCPSVVVDNPAPNAVPVPPVN